MNQSDRRMVFDKFYYSYIEISLAQRGYSTKLKYIRGFRIYVWRRKEQLNLGMDLERSLAYRKTSYLLVYW